MESASPRVPLRALVTGGPQRGSAVAAALERRGFSVTAERRAVEGSGGSWELVRLPGGPFQCYAQLPWAPHPGRAPLWTPDGLAARLDLLAAVAPRLGPRAAVMLAVDDFDPQLPETSAALLTALAVVILEESGRPEARVVTLPAAQLCGPPDAPPALVDGPILHGLGRARAGVVSATG